LVHHYGNTVTRPLRVQYRMHAQIMEFSSEEFYQNTLLADPSVAGHRLCDLPGFPVNAMTETPVNFYDTAGAGWEEELDPESESKHNWQEGAFLLRKADELIAYGLPPRDIAVIAPYAAQVRWMRDHSQHRELEIDTIDGFQGREKEAVLISMVRSNLIGEIGFLGDTRRMNVALTRARRKLIVVGDSSTLAHNEFFSRLLQYFELIGAYRSVWEEFDAS
jgi:ATP-dependent RNA/DNA helicase IGHMBP2